MGILFSIEPRFLAQPNLLGVFFFLVPGIESDLTTTDTLFDENKREDDKARSKYFAPFKTKEPHPGVFLIPITVVVPL